MRKQQGSQALSHAQGSTPTATRGGRCQGEGQEGHLRLWRMGRQEEVGEHLLSGVPCHPEGQGVPKEWCAPEACSPHSLLPDASDSTDAPPAVGPALWSIGMGRYQITAMDQTWLVLMRAVTCALQGTGSLTLPPRSSWSRAARGLSRLTAQSLCTLSGDTPTCPTAREAIPRGYRILTCHVVREHVDSHTHGARVMSVPETLSQWLRLIILCQ